MQKSACHLRSTHAAWALPLQSVTLGDDAAKRRGVQKSVLERAGPPTFDVCVEMLERHRWRVHPNVGLAVDSILAGGWVGG